MLHDSWRAPLAANGLAGLSGVLAALAFAAIILVLQSDAKHSDEERELQSEVVRALMAAFATLIVACLLYSVESGWETGNVDSAVPRYIAIAAGSVLSVGAICLFFAVTILLHLRGLTAVKTSSRFTLLLSLLAILQVNQTCQDLVGQLQPKNDPLDPWWPYVIVLLALALFTVTPTVALSSHVFPRQPMKPALYLIGLLLCGAVVAATLFSSLTPEDPDGLGATDGLANRTLPAVFVVAQLLVSALLTAIFVAIRFAEKRITTVLARPSAP